MKKENDRFSEWFLNCYESGDVRAMNAHWVICKGRMISGEGISDNLKLNKSALSKLHTVIDAKYRVDRRGKFAKWLDKNKFSVREKIADMLRELANKICYDSRYDMED